MSGVNQTSRLVRAERRAFLKLCEISGSSKALAASLLARDEQWMEAANLTFDKGSYTGSVRSFFYDHLITSVLAKSPNLGGSINKRAVALRSFIQSERQCRVVNERVRSGVYDASLVSKVQAVLMEILGPCPTSRDLSRMEEEMRFGPGSSTGMKGLSAGAKYGTSCVQCTPNLVAFRAFGFPKAWRTQVQELTLVGGSKVTTVPKNSKTDRTICIEPDLNIFVQLGVGAVLRNRLLRSGINLNTQEVNQRLAAKLTNCTIDLKAASDTVAESVVELLLPWAWVELLRVARCDKTTVKGQKVRLAKWSSMGNGYTFELESLLFFAISIAVCGWESAGDISVFGDDIVVPREFFVPMVDALKELGFNANWEKSFGDGFFRESCGCDYYRGYNVTPFRWKAVKDEPFTYYSYANSLYDAIHGNTPAGPELLPLWVVFRSQVPEKLRFVVPREYSQGGFLGEPSQARLSYRVKYLQIIQETRLFSPIGTYLLRLHKGGGDLSGGYETSRRTRTRTQIGTGFTFRWIL